MLYTDLIGEKGERRCTGSKWIAAHQQAGATPDQASGGGRPGANKFGVWHPGKVHALGSKRPDSKLVGAFPLTNGATDPGTDTQ